MFQLAAGRRFYAAFLPNLTPSRRGGSSLQGHAPENGMCNLYSITTNQAAIITLFRAINHDVSSRCRGMFPDYPARELFACGERSR
jgi:hypothetical protein